MKYDRKLMLFFLNCKKNIIFLILAALILCLIFLIKIEVNHYFEEKRLIEQELIKKSENEQPVEYRLIQGLNGRYTYRCAKTCSSKCGLGCEVCLMNGESFNRPPKCCFDYGASEEIGWIGCPDCGDVSSEEWFDWYRSV